MGYIGKSSLQLNEASLSQDGWLDRLKPMQRWNREIFVRLVKTWHIRWSVRVDRFRGTHSCCLLSFTHETMGRSMLSLAYDDRL